MAVTVFPSPGLSPPSFSPMSIDSIGIDMVAMMTGAPASAVNVAQTALYVPLQLPAPFTVRKVAWLNGATVGNGATEVGVYTEGGTKIISGSATTANASVWQSVDVTDTVLDPGRYYMAFLAQNATDTTQRNVVAVLALMQAMGVMQEAGLSALPSTATFATPSGVTMPFFQIIQHTLL